MIDSSSFLIGRERCRKGGVEEEREGRRRRKRGTEEEREGGRGGGRGKRRKNSSF